MERHPYRPDPDARGYCTCGLPKRNPRWHTDPPPALPAMDATRPPVGHAHPVTAQAAASRAAPSFGTVRGEVLRLVAEAATSSMGGMTDDELEQATTRTHQSISAASHTLRADGWLQAATLADGTTRTRNTRSGNPATVWTLTPAAHDLTGAPQ